MVLVLAFLFDLLITPFILKRTPDQAVYSVGDYLLCLPYALVTVLVVLRLFRYAATIEATASNWLERALNWLVTPWNRRARIMWLLAGVACLVGGLVLSLILGIGREAQHASWVRLTLNGPLPEQPMLVQYGPQSTDVQPFSWQPGDQAKIAIRPTTPESALPSIAGITTDAGAIDLTTVTVKPGDVTSDLITLTNASGALITVPGSTQHIELTLRGGSGSADIRWLDQQQQVALGADSTRVAFALPAAHQGWALLPAQPIQQLAITMPPASQSYRIHDLTLYADPDTIIWPATASQWDLSSCPAATQASGELALATRDAPCTVRVPLEQPINAINSVALVIAASLVGLGAWAGIFFATRLIRRGTAYAEAHVRLDRPVRLGGWHLNPAWPLRRTMWCIWLLAALYHIIYALVVPLHSTNDSIGYYALAQSLVANPALFSVTIYRTPGYPALLA
ncbi:MAG TPA: hypothetical protein VFT99_14720, partial [Roseiflexaceae bacterium]|nr:hypothetical protein [Roseiflexaceae bacterium]